MPRERYFYRIFGVIIESDFPFPGLASFPSLQYSSGERIFISSCKNLAPRRTKSGWNTFYGLDYWFSSDQRLAIIQSSETGVFRIDFQRKRIDWSSVGEISQEYTCVLLRVRIVGFLVSHLIPALLLHASVVVRNGKGIALGGMVAAGKSTLTASCLNDGFSLLSDDIAALQPNNGHFLLHPGVPEFRLWPWTARRLNPPGMKGEYLAPEIKKKKFLLGPDAPWRFTNKPVPLSCLYLLSRKKKMEGIRIESLKGRKALMGVLENIYNPMIKNPNVLGQQLEIASRLIQKVPVKRLIYPSGFSHLSKVRQAILKDLA